MSHKTKSFLVSLGTGFIFTLPILVMETAITKSYFHSFAVAIAAVIWFLYSIILWGGFFSDVPQGESFFSPRLFKSLAVGLVSVLVILGSMLLLGRMSIPHHLAITEAKNINFAGVIFIWIFIAGLLFEEMFNPNKKIPK